MKTFCVGGRHCSKTENSTRDLKVNPKTGKIVRMIEGKCESCGRSISQFLTYN